MLLDISPAYVIGLVALFPVLLWRLHNYLTHKSYTLKDIPFHKFEGNDAPERYITESRALLHDGYQRYTKKGIPYQMKNPVDPDHPQVILPWKYLEEVKNAGYDKLSFFHFSEQAFLLKYTNAPRPSNVAAHVLRQDMNKNLAQLIASLQDECHAVLSEKMPECEDWTPFQPYMILAHSVARVSSLVMVGPELCRNEEWLNMAVSTTMAVFAGAQTIRQKYSPRWRWLASYFEPGSKLAYASRKRAGELLRPVYEKRRMEIAQGKKSLDVIQWLINASPNGKKNMVDLADDQLFLTLASIHTTSASILSTVYDLLDRPASIAEILEEIRTVKTELQSDHWTKQALFKLEKLDSFMKESQRVNPIGLVTVQRSAVKSYTFKDGFHIPADTQTCFTNYELNHDADIYPDPETFDPHRFLKMRNAKDTEKSKHHFAYVSNQSINFGAGFHACPGRWLVDIETKLVLIEWMQKYDFKFEDGKTRPPDMMHDFSSTPNPMESILIREKKA